MSEELAAAYAFIFEFKDAGGDIVLPHQKGFIQLLADDLGVHAKQHPHEELISLVARLDSSWNKRTQALASEYYALLEQGRVAEADSRREAFINTCPSVWYRGIVEAL